MFAAVTRAVSVEETGLQSPSVRNLWLSEELLVQVLHRDKTRTCTSAAHPCTATETAVPLQLSLPRRYCGIRKTTEEVSIEDG